jgi:predicted ester cyclase
MNPIEVVKAGLAAIESGDVSTVADMLTGDMIFTGVTPQPLGKHEYLGLQSALVAGLPDWKFNATDFQQRGDQVVTRVHITGTQIGALNLPMPGVPVLPPTGKKVALPEEITTLTVKGDKISRIESSNVSGGGVPGILAQLGVNVPQA